LRKITIKNFQLLLYNCLKHNISTTMLPSGTSVNCVSGEGVASRVTDGRHRVIE